jgi:oxygen-independent coproporphyrinogen-3 oxidase
MDRGLYIHIPFCKSKCLYCDFNSYSGRSDLMADYADALAREISESASGGIRTIFIGGGTPTYLPLEGWQVIGEALRGLEITEGAEFSVEANPGTFDLPKLIFLRSLGANRLSIGLQAVQDSHLRGIGRIHSFREFLDGFWKAREAGFRNINVDLMFGLPGQTLEDWKESLETIADLEPEHISCYSLIIEEGTEFWRRHEEGSLELPDEEVEREMYRHAVSFLAEKGYLQYEISNFAKPGRECRHNLIYWDLDEYYGCGAGAHSFVGGVRRSNPEGIEDYISFMKGEGAAGWETHRNSPEDSIEEFMFMGLRKIGGVELADFRERFGRDMLEVYGGVISKFESRGLLRLEEGRLSLTSKGIELSNSVMCEFIL